MKLTKEILDLAKTDNGSYTKEQLATLGVVFVSGENWIEKVIGKIYSKKVLLKFIYQRNGSKKKPSKIVKKKNKVKDRLKEQRKKKRQDRLKQYKDPRWRKLRMFIIERDGYKCQECGASDCVFHVHHLKYYGKYIWSVSEKDLVTLCKSCHDKIHDR